MFLFVQKVTAPGQETAPAPNPRWNDNTLFLHFSFCGIFPIFIPSLERPFPSTLQSLLLLNCCWSAESVNSHVTPLIYMESSAASFHLPAKRFTGLGVDFSTRLHRISYILTMLLLIVFDEMVILSSILVSVCTRAKELLSKLVKYSNSIRCLRIQWDSWKQ